jgi:tetratricopeptide (TPR) repeat protein
VALQNLSNSQRENQQINGKNSKITSSSIYKNSNDFFERGLYNKAISDYDEILQMEPENIQALRMKGLSLLFLNHSEAALPIFRKALTVEPNDTTSLAGMTLSFVSLGRYDEARKFSYMTMATHTNDPMSKTLEGLILVSGGKEVQGMQIIDNVLASQPDNIFALTTKLSILYTQDKLYNESKEYCDRVLAIQPDNALALQVKGQSLIGLKNAQEGLKYIDEAIKLIPDDSNLISIKAANLADLGHLEESLPAYENLLRLEPDNALAWNDKAGVLYDLGKYKEALAAMEKALEIDPSNVMFIRNKSNLEQYIQSNNVVK